MIRQRQKDSDLHRIDSGNLEKAFRNLEGTTVKQFIDQRRKARVTSRLADMSVRGYEIGAELGIVDDLAFYRWVKRAFGNSFASCARKHGANAHQKRVTRNSEFFLSAKIRKRS